MTAATPPPMPPPDLPPGAILQRDGDLRTAIKTGFEDPTRAWFIVDQKKGGGYDSGVRCATWPVVYVPPPVDEVP